MALLALALTCRISLFFVFPYLSFPGFALPLQFSPKFNLFTIFNGWNVFVVWLLSYLMP